MTHALRPPAGAIILTGFMGTGKSAVAELLSRRWGLRSVDTDAMIEEQVGASIAEIFATRGEQHFRDLETEVLTQLAGQRGLIISTGGGMLLRVVRRWRTAARVSSVNASVSDGIGNLGIVSLLHLASFSSC